MDMEEVGDGGHVRVGNRGEFDGAPRRFPRRSRCRRSAKYLLTFGHGYMVVEFLTMSPLFGRFRPGQRERPLASCKLPTADRGGDRCKSRLRAQASLGRER